MMTSHGSGPLGNVISRLSGLKNVSGRKVMPGAEFLEELEAPLLENPTPQKMPEFQNFLPEKNIPEADLGAELTAKSYDVRANSGPGEYMSYNRSPYPENEDKTEEGFFTRLGRSLAEYVTPKFENRSQLPPQNEIANKPSGKELPYLSATTPMPYQGPTEDENYSKLGNLGKFLNYFDPFRSENSYNKALIEDAQLSAKGLNPLEVKNQHHKNLAEDVEKAMEQPWIHSAYGSAEEVANNPVLQAKFKEITGENYDEQIASQTKKYEEAMKGIEDSLSGMSTQLDQQAEAIRQRILNNQSTDVDKYYIGMALLMPLLVGGFFGKEAGLGALAGGAQGIADVYARRGNEMRADEASLLDIGKQQLQNQSSQAEVASKKSEYPDLLRKNLPKDQNEHLIGRQEVRYQDPETGEEKRAIEILPGLVADSQYLTNEKSFDEMRKAARELNPVKLYTEKINDLTDDVISIVNQLDEKSLPAGVLQSFLSGKGIGALSRISKDVNYEGRKVNAGTLLEQKLGLLANAYGTAERLGQMDAATQRFMDRIMKNPENTLINNRDSINEMLEIRKLAQNSLVSAAKNAGFIPEFIIKDLQNKNNKIFSTLNKKENEAQLDEIEKKLYKNSEEKYVK